MTDDLKRMLKQAVTEALTPRGRSTAQLSRDGRQDIPPGAKVLLLSCIDYRYPQRILEAMNELELTGHYYHMSLAGASLAAAGSPGQDVFLNTLKFVVGAGVKGVILLDHLDCAAYQSEVTNPPAGVQRYDFAGEYQCHQRKMKAVNDAIGNTKELEDTVVVRLILPVEAIVHDVPDPPPAVSSPKAPPS